MALPDNFNPFEHLQDTYRKVHNRMVREEFSDLGDENWDPNINVSRGSLRIACTIEDKDTADMVQMRSNLFFFHLRKAKDMQAPIYGLPIGSHQPIRKHKPQIIFYFKEDLEDIENGYAPVEGRISYRLMDEETDTISKTKLITIANKIKTEFATGNGFIWKKGKDLASYTDKKKGYQFQLLVRNKADAKELIDKLLDTNGDTPNWKYLAYKESDEPSSAFPTIPGNQIILGKTYKEPRIRPIASVRFQYATADVWGLPEPVALVDRSFTFLKTLID